MIRESLRKKLAEESKTGNLILFNDPSFDDSILGLSTQDNVVYDYQKMIDEYCNENLCSKEVAEDFIQTNTLPLINYFDKTKNIPIVLMTKEKIKDKEINLQSIEDGLDKILGLLRKNQSDRKILNEGDN